MLTAGNDYARMSDELLDLHLKHLSAGRKSEATRDARRVVLNQLYHCLPFGLVYATTEQLEAWLAGLVERGCSRWTLTIYRYHVRMFYQWAHEAGFLPGNPSASLPKLRAPQSIPDPITEAELELCLTLAEPFRTACILAAFAGLRRAEIAKCRREHITAEALMIPSGKGDVPGVVPTHPFVWEHVANRGPGHLILDRGGRPVRPHWLSVEMRGAFDALGLPDVHLHRLRHRYGTVIQAQTGDIRVTQECLRHASISSTQGYTLVTDERRTSAVNALPIPGARAS
jgi:site-specific recombinase XerD